MKKKHRLSREEIVQQWLELFPRREVSYETDATGQVTLLVPHPENWLTRKILPKPKKPAQKVHLDEIGTYVWQHFDGQHNIRMICEKLTEKFAEKAAGAEERTVLFAQQMYKQHFITVYRDTSQNRPDSDPEE